MARSSIPFLSLGDLNFFRSASEGSFPGIRAEKTSLSRRGKRGPMPDSSMRRGASCRPDFLLYASRFVDEGQWRMNEGRSVTCGSSLVGAGSAPGGRGSPLVVGWLVLVLGPGRWSVAGGVAGGVAASACEAPWPSASAIEAEIMSDAPVPAMVLSERESESNEVELTSCVL